MQNIFSRVEYYRHIKASIENYCYKCIETSLSNYLFLCHFKNLGLNYTVWSWSFSVFLLCYPYCGLVPYVYRISTYILVPFNSDAGFVTVIWSENEDIWTDSSGLLLVYILNAFIDIDG